MDIRKKIALSYLKRNITVDEKKLSTELGFIILEYCQGDYEKTADLIERMRVVYVVETRYVINIITERPGHVIGKAGELINFLSKGLKELGINKRLEITEVKYPAIYAPYDPNEY